MPEPMDLREKQTKLYTCGGCGRVILYRLPIDLKGEFRHVECRRETTTTGKQ